MVPLLREFLLFVILIAGRDCSHDPLLIVSSPQASFDFTTPFPGSDGATPLASVSPEHAAVRKQKVASPKGTHGDAGNRTPVAIILEPARELAEQVSDCLTSFKVSVYGCRYCRNSIPIGTEG